MKKNILLGFLLWIFALPGYTAYYVVSNQADAERDFSSIQSAIEQASPMDTIFVKGSPMNYGNVLLEKPLVLIGEGFSGEIHSGHTAKLTRIVFTSNPYRRTIASGSVIIGFEFPYFPGQRANIVTISNERSKIENITIERNWLWFVEVGGSGHNWTFRNNIIRGWVNGGGSESNSLLGSSGFSFYNNILNSLISFTLGELTIENNIILGRLKDVNDAKVRNNIFTRDEYILENVYASDFQNNIVMGTKVGGEDCYAEKSSFEAVFICNGAGNTGSRNQIGFDPGFVYWPADDIMGGTAFKLSDGSHGRHAGTNRSEVGIFGGKYPFPSKAFLNPEIDDPFPSFVTSIY